MGAKVKMALGVIALVVLVSAGSIASHMFGKPEQTEVSREIPVVALGDDGIERGGQNWTSFLKASNSRQPTSIRIQDTSLKFDSLLQYDGEYFYYENQKYKYLLELEGRMPNAAKDSELVILTDEIYSFGEVVKSMYSSNSDDFLPYKLLFGT